MPLMDSKPVMEAIKLRAFEARIPIYLLCEKAGVSAARFTQHTRGEQVSVTTIGKLEKAMAAVEAERAAPCAS